jgi:hypothetical protein
MNKSETLIFFGMIAIVVIGLFLYFHEWSPTKVASSYDPIPVPLAPTPPPLIEAKPTSVPTETPTIPDPLAEIQNAVGSNVISLAQNTDGKIWIGSEGRGLFRVDEGAPPGQRVTHYDEKSGLADSIIYGLCVDQQGRVWAGHLNHGVSVFNGSEWRNYDILQGPIGERIYDLTCSKKDGSIWMATSAGGYVL